MFKKVAMNLGLRWAGKQAREIAEGKQGPKAQAVYLWFQGKKRFIGGALGFITVALVGAGKADVAVFITGPLAALFLSIGFIDANWRDAPKFDSTWLRLLRAHAIDVSALLAAATLAATQCTPEFAAAIPFGITCQQLATGLGSITAVLAHLGLSAEAQSATPPATGRTL